MGDRPSDEASAAGGGSTDPPAAERKAKKKKESDNRLCPRGGAKNNILSYLIAQSLIPEDELEALAEMMAKPLPVVFRVHDDGSAVPKWLRHVMSNFRTTFIDNAPPADAAPDPAPAPDPPEGSKDPKEAGGKREPPATLTPEEVAALPMPRMLEWDPRGRVWHFDFDRKTVRRTPALGRFKTFLEEHTDMGHIVRQEAVSMLPPLLLGVQPNHRVLDMCAAPGSKTTQLLEDLINREKQQGPSQLLSPPTGVVVANDADYSRACMLTHRVRALHSPCVLVCSHMGEDLPFPAEFFDRVLCDVPCSGDGTVRKAPNMKWRSAHSVPLNCIQVQLCLHSLRLLKVGGLMTYSTCSMNPVENEAVMAEVLRRAGGSLEVVDASAHLPGVARRPGVATWRVQDVDKPKEWLDDFSQVPEARRWRMPSSLFPNGDGADPAHASSAPAIAAALQRCWRLYPHLQNTGGFFIALLRKTAPLPAAAFDNLPTPPDVFGQERKRETQALKRKAAEEADALGAPATKAGEGVEDEAGLEGDGEEHDPLTDRFVPIQGSERGREVWDILSSHYGISGLPTEQLLVTSETCSNISFVSEEVAKLVKDYPTLRLISAGVRLFIRSSNVIAPAPAAADAAAPSRPVVKTRICGGAGADLLSLYMTKYLVHVSLPVLRKMIKTQIDSVCRAEQLEEMGVTALFEALGSCEDTVFVLGCKETGAAPIYMPTYKGHHTTKLLLKRRELIALDEALMFEYGACV